MFKHSLFLVLWLVASGSVFAQATNDTLFAVDLSLDTEDRNAAFEIIRETTLSAPETQSFGLTLFDDTVRGYIAPAPLVQQHMETLNQTIAQAQNSVRPTSNLAVGIERAIDAFSPDERTELVVFSRGVIDTETDDPRARFNEWLNVILLPQAAQSNVAITLVIPQNLGADPQISKAFENSELHQITSMASGTSIPSELVSLLNIPDRAYGKLETAEQIAVNSTTESGQQVSQNTLITQGTNTRSENSDLPMTRMVLLAVACSLLIGILAWRYFSRTTQNVNDDPTMPSSTYLPLTEKPSDTMDYWREKETDLRVDKSADATVPAAADADSTVARGSEKTVRR
ncbi:MAG: hypothetical protein AB8B97_20030 [Granulosicoccus sp.]